MESYTKHTTILTTAGLISLIGLANITINTPIYAIMVVLTYVVFTTSALSGMAIPDIDDKNSILAKMSDTNYFLHTGTKPNEEYHTPYYAIRFSLWSIVLGSILCTLFQKYIYEDTDFSENIGMKIIALIGVFYLSRGLGLFYGYMMHLVEDKMAGIDIMWLYPIKKTHKEPEDKISKAKMNAFRITVCALSFVGQLCIGLKVAWNMFSFLI